MLQYLSRTLRPHQDEVDELLADVVSTCDIVRVVLFSRDELFGLKELPTCSANFVHHRWLKIDEHREWRILSCACFRPECVDRVVSSTDGLVTRQAGCRQNNARWRANHLQLETLYSLWCHSLLWQGCNSNNVAASMEHNPQCAVVAL